MLKNAKAVVSFDFTQFNIKVSDESELISDEFASGDVRKRAREKNISKSSAWASSLQYSFVKKSINKSKLVQFRGPNESGKVTGVVNS